MIFFIFYLRHARDDFTGWVLVAVDDIPVQIQLQGHAVFFDQIIAIEGAQIGFWD